MQEEMISVIDIAKKLSKRKQSIFKIMRKLNIETYKEKNTDSRGQLISYITKKDEKMISDYLRNTNIKPTDGLPSSNLELNGVFYLIQLEPTHDPGRFKVGFATSIEERIRKHKCSAPLLKIINKWPCKLLWEKTAIDCVTADCEQIHTEVFRTNSIDSVKDKCEMFFNIMPKI